MSGVSMFREDGGGELCWKWGGGGVGSRKYITITCPCNVYSLISHFYLAKLGYAGLYLFFLIFASEHRL